MKSRSPQGLHRLWAAAIKYIDEPGWHADGGGLYLKVDRSGRKRWAMRITVAVKRRDFGLGPLHKVTLAQARDRTNIYRSNTYSHAALPYAEAITAILATGLLRKPDWDILPENFKGTIFCRRS